MPDNEEKDRIIKGSKGTYTLHGKNDKFASVTIKGVKKHYASNSPEYKRITSDIKYHDEDRHVKGPGGKSVQASGPGTGEVNKVYEPKPTYNNQGTTKAVVKNALDEDSSVIKKKGE